MSKNEILKVGISLGDYNGVGPEVILKAISNPKLLELCLPVVYGSSKVISFYKKHLNLHELNFHFTKSADQLNSKKPNLVLVWEEETPIEPGKAGSESGNYAFMALERAAADVKAGVIDVLVTAPLDKSTVNNAQRPFRGHTEYLAEKSGSSDYLMMLVCDALRVALVTAHLPLKEVPALITKDRVLEKIRSLNGALRKDFGITKPRIAVLGLNPHAGDKGLLGKEEQDHIFPAVESAMQEGIMAFGPYPADGFFGARQFEQFDAVLAMYHDQGLSVFKYLGFEDGVNFTAGLPFVRTSPDHGTAYTIAGKNLAIEDSTRNAIYLACDIFRKRNQMEDASKNPLRFTPLKRERFRMEF